MLKLSLNRMKRRGYSDSETGSNDFRLGLLAITVGSRDRNQKFYLLGPFLILPDLVQVKLVLLSPLVGLMINPNRRLYASCAPNLFRYVFDGL